MPILIKLWVWFHDQNTVLKMWCSFRISYLELYSGRLSLLCLAAQSCSTLSWPHGLLPTRFLCPWDFFSTWSIHSKNTGVDCHFLFQGIFPTQGSNPHLLCLLYCRRILYLLSHQGSPLSLLTIVNCNYPTKVLPYLPHYRISSSPHTCNF